MYAYFDKHGKKLMAVFAAVLALAFILPGSFGNGGGRGAGQFGKLDGKEVDSTDIALAQNTLRSVDRLMVPDRGPDGRPQFVSLPAALLAPYGNGLYRQLDSNPVLLHLLMVEAAKAGAVPSDAALDRFLAPPVRLRADRERDLELDKVNPAVKDALRDDLRRLFSVLEYFNRAQAGIKVSRPLVDDQIARGNQQVKARVALFNAADYEAQVAAPTADELKRQFDAYASVAAAATNDNPFGFGYLVPNRVAVQWLIVPDAEVAKVVEASKPAERWEEDAILYHRRHENEFQTTQPADRPTTRPFAEAKAEVLTKLREPLIDQKKREVGNRITQQLNALVPANATAASQPNNDPAYSFDALQKVADAVQKQTGVRPTAVAPAGLLSRDQLARQPGFGDTMVTDRVTGFAGGPAYVFDVQRAFRADSATAASTLDVGRPTPALSGRDGTYIARVVAVEKAHPPASIDAVKTEVERDVRRSRAYTLANDAAQAALDQANTAGGLARTPATRPAVLTTDWFGATDPTPAGLTGDFTAGLVAPAFDALRGVATPSALPARTLVKLRAAGRAAVVEVFDVRTTLTTKDEAQAREQAERVVVRQMLPPTFVAEWFDFDSVSRRVGYVPDAPRKPVGPADPRNPASPNNPANPFVPG